MKITNTSTTDLTILLEGTKFHIVASGNISVNDKYNSEVESLVAQGYPISFSYADEAGLQGIPGVPGTPGADYAPVSGLSTAFPVGTVDGEIFFATDLNKPFWFNNAGLGTKWFDAMGVEFV